MPDKIIINQAPSLPPILAEPLTFGGAKIFINQPAPPPTTIIASPLLRGDVGPSVLDLFRVNTGNPTATLADYENHLMADINAAEAARLTEVADARQGEPSLGANLNQIKADATNSNAEVIAARQGEATLGAKIESIDNNVEVTDIKANVGLHYFPEFELIAHRGFMGLYPENTIYSALKAIEHGASPECDLRFTSDGEIVLLHDGDIDRTTNGTGIISDLTYAQVSSYDAGVKTSAMFDGIKVPKFSDYLIAVRKAKRIYPELRYRTVADIGMITQMLVDYGFENKANLMSLDFTLAAPYIREVSKIIQIGCLVTTQEQFDEAVILCKLDKNCSIALSYTIATTENSKILTDNNIEGAVWTVSSWSSAQYYLKLGYRKIISDLMIGEV